MLASVVTNTQHTLWTNLLSLARTKDLESLTQNTNTIMIINQSIWKLSVLVISHLVINL